MRSISLMMVSMITLWLIWSTTKRTSRLPITGRRLVRLTYNTHSGRVGAGRLERPTSRSRTARATELRYAPE